MQKGFKIITFKLHQETHWRQGRVIYLEKKNLEEYCSGRNLGQDMDAFWVYIGGAMHVPFFI